MDAALTELEEAYRQRSPMLGTVAVDPFLRRLHFHPRFAALLHRLNLPPR